MGLRACVIALVLRDGGDAASRVVVDLPQRIIRRQDEIRAEVTDPEELGAEIALKAAEKRIGADAFQILVSGKLMPRELIETDAEASSALRRPQLAAFRAVSSEKAISA